MYLQRLLAGQLLCGGGAVLVNTIKHPGLRLKEERKQNEEEGERDLKRQILLTIATSVEICVHQI